MASDFTISVNGVGYETTVVMTTAGGLALETITLRGRDDGPVAQNFFCPTGQTFTITEKYMEAAPAKGKPAVKDPGLFDDQ
jgi:hypothetical protein